MKRLRVLILIFCVALSIPLAYVVFRTYRGLEQEEVGELRYFAETLFDKMEEELASLVLKEEGRAIDEYRHNYPPSDEVRDFEGMSGFPLFEPSPKSYILGYLQNNPDGSFQTPWVEGQENVAPGQARVIGQLKDVNEAFNLKRTSVPEKVETEPAEIPEKVEKERAPSFASRYLDVSRSQKQKAYLGQEKKRVEEITADKAFSLAQRGDVKVQGEERQEAWIEMDQDTTLGAIDERDRDFNREKGAIIQEESHRAAPSSDLEYARPSLDAGKLQVEIDPMQSVFIDDSQVFIFRRIPTIPINPEPRRNMVAGSGTGWGRASATTHTPRNSLAVKSCITLDCKSS